MNFYRVSKTLFIGLIILSQAAMAKGVMKKLKELELNTLVELIAAAEMTEEIEKARNLTLVAPSEDAFDDIEGQLKSLKNNPSELRDILNYHIGIKRYSIKKALKDGEIKTLNGRIIRVKSNSAGVFLENNIVVYRNLKAGGLTVHVIDELLIPNETIPYNEIKPVDSLDLEQYQGKWYEIEKFPNKFEEGCFNVTADYTLNKKGKVNVLNTCVKSDGTIKTSKGKASVKNKKTNSQLKVSFVPFFKNFGLFSGDYNVLAIGKNYEYALVGSKSKEFLWILARDPEIPESILKKVRAIAAVNGYDISKLEPTPKLTTEQPEQPEQEDSINELVEE